MNITKILVIGLLTAAPAFVATAAMAIDSRDAIKACDANPKCNFTVSDGGVTIVIKDGNGGSTVIDCPAVNGKCQVVIRKPTIGTTGPLTGSLSSGDSSSAPAGGGYDTSTATLYMPAPSFY